MSIISATDFENLDTRNPYDSEFLNDPFGQSSSWIPFEQSKSAAICHAAIQNIQSQLSLCIGLKTERFTSSQTQTDPSKKDALFEYVNWALETGMWDGCPLSPEDAPAHEKEIELRIFSMLASMDPSSLEFRQTILQLALVGASLEERAIIEQDMEELGLNGPQQTGGFWHCAKKALHWAKKHKTAIIVGTVAVAVTTVVCIVTFGTGAAAAGQAAAATSCAILDSLVNREDPCPPPSEMKAPSLAVEPSPSLSIADSLITPPPPPQHEPQPTEIKKTPPSLGERTILEDGILIDGRFTSYREYRERIRLDELLAQSISSKPSLPHTPELPKPTFSDTSNTHTPLLPKEKSFFDHPVFSILSDIGRSFTSQDALDFSKPISERRSRHIETPGTKTPHMSINIINGVGTSVDEAISHAQYISSFTPGMSVGLVYNQSHGVIADLAEALFFSHLGFSPNTARLKKEKWEEFHTVNKDRPHAKILEICHSKGGIDLKNALMNSSPEIRDRIIVVNIGPGATITDDLCFMRFNYACTDDLVNLGELIHPFLQCDRFLKSGQLAKVMKERENIIYLDPHPDSEGMGHGFQDPVFAEKIRRHINDYIKNHGEYKEKNNQ